MSKLGGSACKYIKKAKYCTSPCTKIHSSGVKHKWYCKQTKKCLDKKKRHKKRKTMKRKSVATASSSSFF